VAERVFGQILGFSGFGFPKAHSAAFGLLAYQSAWLRVHYGPEFLCSLLNEQPMGFYPPDALVHEAQRRAIEVLGPDVNRSAVDCRVEARRLAVRVGLGYVKGVKEEEMKALVTERDRGGPFADLGDLASRSGACRNGLERLAWSGALDELTRSARRPALWRLGTASGGHRVPAGTQLSLPLEPPRAPELPALGRWETVLADYSSTGMTLGDHPLGLLRAELGDGVLRAVDLERADDGSLIEVAGLVVARQRPATARGVVFMLLEDESGTINLVLPPPVFARFRGIARASPLLRARGRLERRQGAINVVVSSLRALQRPDLPLAEVRRIEPPTSRETDKDGGDAVVPRLDEVREARERAVAELRAVAPVGHSFGRRGR
jgi:error-prone DNA polymerase